MIEVREATVADYVTFYKDMQFPGFSVFDGDKMVGMVGIALGRDANYWGYFDVDKKLPFSVGYQIARGLERSLRSVEHDVFVLCQQGDFATAPRFLRLIGFKPTGESINGEEIWVCPGSK